MLTPDDPRVRALHDGPIDPRGAYVLYWMIAARRTAHSVALDRAIAHARALDRPLLVYEPVRAGYPWASDRHTQFILDGMLDQRARFESAGVCYLPYVEPAPGAAKGMLSALAARACVVVTDDHPTFHYPRMLAAAGAIGRRIEAVDGNGLLPMRAAPQAFERAYSFRRYAQRALPAALKQVPTADPLAGLSLPSLAAPPADVTAAWPSAPMDVSVLPIDHAVRPCMRGGAVAGRARLDSFVKHGLSRYASARNDLDDGAASGLSPYLHFGHIGAHEVFARIAARERWSLDKLGPKATGEKDGWWGMSPEAEGLLDQVVTWREAGFNYCALRPDHDRYESLPAWARETLEAHQGDARKHTYPLAALDAARTHDPLWNAAQRQLVREGVIHNYLRMLWGKKILEWSPTPRDALAAMIELNNRYALDGRDPNSYSGIFWVLGRYDRPWFPARDVYGTVRYMSSENTARKLRVKGYLARYGEQRALL